MWIANGLIVETCRAEKESVKDGTRIIYGYMSLDRFQYCRCGVPYRFFIKILQDKEPKGKDIPMTGHEGPEGE